MTKEEKSRIIEMRRDGCGYKSIAASLGVPLYTVKTFCRRNALMSADIAEMSPCDIPSSPNANVSEIRLGNTVFVITTSHSEKATESLEEKLKTLITNAAAKECETYHFVHE